MGALRTRRMAVVRTAVILLTILAGTAVRAADEEPVCRFLLQQIGAAANRANAANDEVLERAKYLQKIALMERSALQGPYPSTAGVFDAELARAEQSLDAAKARSGAADAATGAAETMYVQQCPRHFAAIHGDYTQLAILVSKAMSDSSP